MVMPKLGVNVAVFRNGRILLTKREDFEVWCLPGGGIEDGESFAQAAVRETREETGLEVRLTRLVGVYSRLGPRGDVHIVLFAAQPVGGQERLQPGEVIEIGWFREDEIPQDTMDWYRRRIANAFNDVGSAVAWVQQPRSKLSGPEITRTQLYQLRDESSLSRRDFYYEMFEQMTDEDETLEVGD